MYIKEIIIDGFKSYATRTIIKGFDISFNAITGFNGSGKSNILDAILFVLGLNKEWEVLRVKKMQELVYKQGHAGITKAEVTVTFDNTNKEQSPLGYENCDQIQVTRQVQQEKSKYFVNGTKENLNKVKNMFRSVQLNIDNPHFLVAQGRITKIINLKPLELISMLEETAGTALYNEKKRESEKIIKKKEEKVKEINDLIETDIQPKMKKLKKEREEYLIWKSSEIEINRMERQLKAYEYFNKNQLLKDRQIELEDHKKLQLNTQKELKNSTQEYQVCLDELKKYGRQQDQEGDKKLKKLEEKCKELEEKISECEKQREITKKHQQQSIQDLKIFQKKQKDCEDTIQKNQKELEYQTKYLTEITNEIQQKKDQLNEANQMQNQDGSNLEGVKEQLDQQIKIESNKLKSIQNEIAKLDAQIKQKQITLKNNKETLEFTLNEQNQLNKQIEILEREIKHVEDEIDKSTFNPNVLRAREQERNNYDQQIMHLQHKIEAIIQNQGNYIFKLDYRDPEPGFDKSRIKGRVFSLFQPKSSEYIEALEAGAGGKLQFIIVQDEQTSKILLQKRSFNFNVRFIPNNKIVGEFIDRQIIEESQKIAKEMGGWAEPAYNLIKYDESMQKSMLFVFGNFMVCSNQAIAKAICFNKNVRLRIKCVSLEGDILDPSGTLSGGYQDRGNLLLERYYKYSKVVDEKNELVAQRGNLMENIKKLKEQESYYNGLSEIYQNRQKYIR
ncbi:structural maintenance of chromosomes 2, putative [Ichthyophthirius multifiliis]|uniref:Structural maintenance of chromosomes 2, putative n=1 Tax=Ichthyophthirius multifiliis TaxID=5932 RepID=G0R5C3_ICHMU|nr:structural maintenance of chromosomes 2, putative [Ichthyophthirius multifiliis]EGR27336.1 structural maintenance of chromosomes 2, putative [Ichthyophthirius multifiliis]|eukprot:XP_004024220.1 structural maintenance of chromosomes 2, putative [Ichthyophthirius multifiliis]